MVFHAIPFWRLFVSVYLIVYQIRSILNKELNFNIFVKILCQHLAQVEEKDQNKKVLINLACDISNKSIAPVE